MSKTDAQKGGTNDSAATACDVDKNQPEPSTAAYKIKNDSIETFTKVGTTFFLGILFKIIFLLSVPFFRLRINILFFLFFIERYGVHRECHKTHKCIPIKCITKFVFGVSSIQSCCSTTFRSNHVDHFESGEATAH